MKYAVENIATEAVEGRTVIVCGQRAETDHLLRQVEHIAAEYVSKVYRAHGRERIEMQSGGQVIPVNSARAIRGRTANTVYLCPSINSRKPGWAENVWPAVAPSDGEVIPI